MLCSFVFLNYGLFQLAWNISSFFVLNIINVNHTTIISGCLFIGHYVNSFHMVPYMIKL